MHKIKPGSLTAGTVKSNFKGTIERFVTKDNALSFMSPIKGTLAYWKQFLNDVLGGTLINFSIFSRPLPEHISPLSANPTKWSNTLKQFVGFCRRIV